MTETIKYSLKKGFTLIDKADLEIVSRYKWYSVPEGYATAYLIGGGHILLHRLLMNPAKGLEVDHINGNGLDNRRENLRNVTRAENLANSKRHSDSKSPYKGVDWFKPAKKWRARLCYNGHGIGIGYYDSPEEAARNYDAFALIIHRENARLNFPTGGIQ